MEELPTGTLTLLFSDIEGSTALLHTLGSRWGDALSDQRAILRAAFTGHGGREMGTEGDSFFVVFRSAHDALGAAIEAQRRMLRHAFPDGATVRVRMGLHTGEPRRHEDGYIGEDVHRAARIAATAHGGQIVLSAATGRLIRDLPGVELRDLGRHRLKDLPDGEHLYDVVAPDLLTEFPALRSLGRGASLPPASTPLIGREDELAAMAALLTDREAALITLTGPGGSGKTRLATAAAAAAEPDFIGGVYLAQLHAVRTGAQLWPAIEEVLDAHRAPGSDARERVCGFLADRRALLVLDNVEQIPDADVVVGQLLSAAPHARVIATSRRPLLLIGERELPVEPLALPSSDDFSEVLGSAAVAMFVQHARMARPSFEVTPENGAALATLCRRLDGLPLALELAAANVRMLTPTALLGRLGSRLGQGVTASDRPDRQRSLGATIAWSYDMVAEADRRIFRRLAVFRGPADLDAVEQVAGVEEQDVFDVVSRLVGISLLRIVAGSDGEPRVSLLETIRDYALEQLTASGELEVVRLRHLRWCRTTVERLTDLLRTARHTQALDRLALLDDDIRAALDFALHPAGADGAERLAIGQELLLHVTTRYWYRFGSHGESRSWQERGLALAGDEDTAANVRLLHGYAISMLQQGEVLPALALFDQALEMATRLGDTELKARSLNSAGIAHRLAGQPDRARRCLEASLELAQSIDDAVLQATALGNLAVVHIDQADYAAAVEASRASMRLNEASGDEWGLAIDRLNYAGAVLRSEGAAAAHEHFDRWAPAITAFRDNELAIDVLELGSAIAAGLGSAPVAARLLGAADARRAAFPMPRSVTEQRLMDESLAPARAASSSSDWDDAYESGRGLEVEPAIAAVRALGSGVT